MGFDFAAQKARSSRIVHDTFAMDMTYQDERLIAPVALRVRWHYKQAPVGDIEGEGYAVFLDYVEKVIFDKEELAAKGVVVRRGGRLTIRATGFEGVLTIDSKEKTTGPVGEAWRVGALNGGLAT